MTLTINDTRNNQKGVLWDSLEAGHVYIDNNGRYVMAVDSEDFIINFSEGEVVSHTEYDVEYDRFIPVKAKLEIFG